MPKPKHTVLFVCIHNSARSQMAEELLRAMAGERFSVESAGIEPGVLNPDVVKVLREEGIDISGKDTRAVREALTSGRLYDFVITVCDKTSAEKCPVFPGPGQRLHWSFPDPSQFSGDEAQRLAEVRKVRDAIKHALRTWVASLEPIR